MVLGAATGAWTRNQRAEQAPRINACVKRAWAGESCSLQRQRSSTSPAGQRVRRGGKKPAPPRNVASAAWRLKHIPVYMTLTGEEFRLLVEGDTVECAADGDWWIAEVMTQDCGIVQIKTNHNCRTITTSAMELRVTKPGFCVFISLPRCRVRAYRGVLAAGTHVWWPQSAKLVLFGQRFEMPPAIKARPLLAWATCVSFGLCSCHTV